MNYNRTYDQILKQIVQDNPKSYSRVLRSKGFKGRYVDRTYLIDYIYACTKALDDEEFEYSLKTRLYWTLNYIKSFDDPRVRCKQCGKPIRKWNVAEITLGYKSTCCYKCSRQFAQKQTILHLQEQYGEDVTNVFQLDSVKAQLAAKKDETHVKRQATNKRKYGTVNNAKKGVATRIKKYGNSFNLKECVKTWKRKYNVNNPMQVYDIKQKQQSAQYVYNGIKFDSSWEIAYYIWLTDNGIEFIYQPQEPALFYYDDKNVMHRYYPDFLVNRTTLVELKGDNAFDEDRNAMKNGWLDWSAKYKCMKDNNVVMYMKDDVLPFLKHVEQKFGKDFLRKCRVQH